MQHYFDDGCWGIGSQGVAQGANILSKGLHHSIEPSMFVAPSGNGKRFPLISKAPPQHCSGCLLKDYDGRCESDPVTCKNRVLAKPSLDQPLAGKNLFRTWLPPKVGKPTPVRNTGFLNEDPMSKGYSAGNTLPYKLTPGLTPRDCGECPIIVSLGQYYCCSKLAQCVRMRAQ